MILINFKSMSLMMDAQGYLQTILKVLKRRIILWLQTKPRKLGLEWFQSNLLQYFQHNNPTCKYEGLWPWQKWRFLLKFRSIHPKLFQVDWTNSYLFIPKSNLHDPKLIKLMSRLKTNSQIASRFKEIHLIKFIDQKLRKSLNSL